MNRPIEPCLLVVRNCYCNELPPKI